MGLTSYSRWNCIWKKPAHLRITHETTKHRPTHRCTRLVGWIWCSFKERINSSNASSFLFPWNCPVLKAKNKSWDLQNISDLSQVLSSCFFFFFFKNPSKAHVVANFVMSKSVTCCNLVHWVIQIGAKDKKWFQ